MPIIQVKYSAPQRHEPLDARVAAKVSSLAAEFLGKDPAVTAAIVEEVSPDRWFCGGRSLAEQGLASFWLDIRVTDSTNTKDEKASFIAHTFSAMQSMLGPLHEESYVHVNDVHAYAYGFGGLTQEQRYVAAKLGATEARVARRA